MWIEAQATAEQAGMGLPAWHEFLEGDLIEFDDPGPDTIFLSAFRDNPAQHPLPTPSGRIELASAVIAGFGYEDCPGHPVWSLPRGRASGQVNNYPLHLLSGQPETRLHSQYDNGSFSRSRKIQGREPLLLNPSDAAERGIEDGDVVVVFNQRGCCLAGAVVTSDIRQGVVFLWTGAWYDPDFSDPQHLDRHGNPNVLTHDLRTSRLSQGSAVQSAFVDIARYDGVPPPVETFDPPRFEPVG